ncbi:MAG: GAF domain-containing sensor histidine kinase [Marmoricola sp.]
MDTQLRDLERDAEVRRYQVAGLAQTELDDLAQMAAHLCAMPVALINLIQGKSQITIAAAGADAEMCAREDSMCNSILYDPEPVVVPDASKDPRWVGNPFVDGTLESYRFYCAHQLVTPRGVVIGTLCVFDHVPRELNAEADLHLELIGRRVIDLLELRLRTHELEESVTELTGARDELRRSNELLGTFAGQVAHDLRGPLTSVGLSLGMLQHELEDLGVDQDWLIQRALASTTRMDSLIADMLSYAAVGGQPELKQVDLQSELRDILDDLHGALSGVEVVALDLPVVLGDPTQWRMVLQNLISNALKFTQSGESPLIRVSVEVTSTGWTLEVCDNGPGVPIADRERVFAPMTQGDPRVDGIGLGLATCRRIVEAHAGTIRMDSAPEGGARVVIEVPLGPRLDEASSVSV